MVTYKERLKKRKYYVINKDNVTLGLWTGLKKLCEDMKEKDSSFPSYWTITRMDKSKPIDVGDYIIQELQTE